MDTREHSPQEVSRPDRVDRASMALDQALRDAPSVDLSWVRTPLREDGWEAAPDLLRLLFTLVETVRPPHVVEFGSGLSTLVLARAARRTGDCVISSIDHDPNFVRETGDRLCPEDAKLVSLQFAPLVARGRAGRLRPAYLTDPERLGSERPADLVFVDGPPQVLGGRSGMLYQALEYSQAGTIVLMDDADRAGERDALSEWQAVFGDAIRIRRPEGYARGVAAVILAAPTVARIRMAPAPR